MITESVIVRDKISLSVPAVLERVQTTVECVCTAVSVTAVAFGEGFLCMYRDRCPYSWRDFIVYGIRQTKLK